MKTTNLKTHLIIRLEKGEEIVSSIIKACEENNIKLGILTGIGAMSYVEVGYFDIDKKEYFSNEYNGHLEIISLMGNITTKDEKVYLHPHIIFSDEGNFAKGGHLNKGIISATGEIIIQIIDGRVNRYFDEEIGLNLMEL